MMSVLACTALLLAQVATNVLGDAWPQYQARCEAARQATIKALEIRIERATDDPSLADRLRQELSQVRLAPAASLPMTLPPKKGDLGALPRAGATQVPMDHFVDVLEVVNEKDAIVRAWYLPEPAESGDGTSAIAEDPTFVDLWVRGVDTSKLAPGKPAVFSEVFTVTGTQTFGTTCGQRGMLLLEPVAGK